MWPRGTYQMLVVEEVHHAGRPVAHGDEVRGRPVQAQQAQRSALLHAVHGVPDRRAGVRPAWPRAHGRRPRPQGTEPTDDAPQAPRGQSPRTTPHRPQGTEPTDNIPQPQGIEPMDTTPWPQGTEPKDTTLRPQGTEPTDNTPRAPGDRAHG